MPQEEKGSLKEEDFYVVYKHVFINRCELLAFIMPIILVMGLFNLVIFLVWFNFVFRVWKGQ